ncbi:branched-chain amino acid ABC transporter ATP-binding protein/permease [Plantactinospora sp. KLBMP9567]|uniref:branched-chain amino acid ABC transporter ATP-binding protein/permease n=1 Tax=Plantactinospora sp. KLBMP9567 TaxID=3085900 RepID=UPI0029812563|nr:branched-chain amino acid ABC transporter ATP-binding protein/permease [Plantactinospora sp. KLBMP9567]MDW5330606.1 branched-chain amino acid ABC transporter ATP-binding protein/permease [Plantactinospora sp. KLBMP9567]
MIRRGGVGLLVAFLVLAALGASADQLGIGSFYLVLLGSICFWIAQATSWNLLSGYSGYFSFGQAAYVGVGAYTTAVLSGRHNVDFFLTLPLAAVFSGLLALGVGAVAFRLGSLRGEIFALLTLAVPFILAAFARINRSIDGGQGTSVPVPELPGPVSSFQQFQFLLALLIATIAVAVAYLVQHTRSGSALAAIRDAEDVAEVTGVATFRYKMLAMLLSGVIGGVAGSVYALQIGFVTVESVFGLTIPLFVIVMGVLGGRSHWLGPVIGAVLIVTLQDRLSSYGLDAYNMIILGGILALLVALAPDGLYARLRARPLVALGTLVGVSGALAVLRVWGELLDWLVVGMLAASLVAIVLGSPRLSARLGLRPPGHRSRTATPTAPTDAAAADTAPDDVAVPGGAAAGAAPADATTAEIAAETAPIDDAAPDRARIDDVLTEQARIDAAAPDGVRIDDVSTEGAGTDGVSTDAGVTSAGAGAASAGAGAASAGAGAASAGAGATETAPVQAAATHLPTVLETRTVPIQDTGSRGGGSGAVLVECRGVARYFGGVHALEEVTLDIREGELVGLVGPNGSGKTTLVNVLSGTIRPTRGTIRIGGQDITRLAPHRIAHVGMARTYQIPRPFDSMTVRDNVAMAIMFGRTPMSLRRARPIAERHLGTVALAHLADAYPSSLNLHQRQLLEMARAVAANPRVLLLDEALAGLNPAEVDNAVRVVRRIHDSGITIVIVEHLLRVLNQLATRLVVLDRGSCLADGDPQTVLNDPAVVRAYLGRQAHV